MSNNNKMPEGWGQNKSVPDSWKKGNELPENWGKQSGGNRVSGTSSAAGTNQAQESDVSISELAHTGAGLLAGAAKKIGGAAKNAAGSAGAAMSNMKDKTVSYAAEHKFAGENSAETEYQEVPDYVSSQEEHDRSVDEMIEEALAASGESPEGAEYDTVPEEQTVVDNTPVNAVSEPVTDQPPVQNAGYYEQPVGDQMQLYGYKEKKSPVVYVMAGIIAVLLVGGGILGGMLLMKDNGDKSDRIAASVPKTQDQTVDETVSYENTTPSETGNTTTSAIETNVTTIDATKNATNNNEAQATPVVTGNKLKFYSSDKINDYPAYLEKLRDLQTNGTYRDQNNGFFLCDINEDDTPELFVTFNTEEPGILFAGSVYSGELVTFAEFMGAGMLRGITLFDNGAIGITSGGNEGHGISYKYYNGGNSFSDQNNNDEYISYIYENGSLSYISYAHQQGHSSHLCNYEK